MSTAKQVTTSESHPSGLFLLFFVEMWERFSFYGMRALLTFYLIKGFLKADDGKAYAIYGAYGALVYATPYLGGISLPGCTHLGDLGRTADGRGSPPDDH